MSRRILVVDDDASIRDTFAHHLGRRGFTVAVADSAEQALGAMAATDPTLVITDVRMPGMSGLELLRELRTRVPDVDVVVITAHEDMATAVAAMRDGACDYLVKPLDLDHIDLLVDRCFREQDTRARAKQLAAVAAEPYGLNRLVGRDPAMIEIYKLVGTLATNRAPVLIRGETGTGKEVIARAIHYNSAAAADPFVAVNCTAVPEPLLESELFGHVRGAFTGATADRKGRFEQAGSGTIFLDEIGDTTPAFQSKLLRVLQEREYQPVGSERPRRTDARVIAATHRPIEELVRTGGFREDLYFRLRVVEITIPPLRERRSDIPLLVDAFLARIARELHLPHLALALDAADALVAHDWPGNVRELENALYRAAVLARGRTLCVEHLALSSAEASPANAIADPSLATAERTHVARVMELTRGNKRRAARLLRISRSRLDRLLDRHGLAKQGETESPQT
jgi:two-component system, NtrC family, response regulator AtoC